MRILVFQTAFLGDAILCIPLLKALRYFYPKSEIGFVCRQGVGELFLRSRIADVVIEVDKKSKKSLKHCFRQTREFRADIIVSPHRSLRTALWVWRLKAKLSVGYNDWWAAWAYNRKVKRLADFHDTIRQILVIEGLGHRLGTIPDACLSLKLDIEPSAEFQTRFKNAVAFAPGSQWDTKRWTLEGFTTVAQSLESAGFSSVVVGAPNEKELCETMAKKLTKTENMAGKTSIYELAQLLQSCKALICNDSGAMHVATVVETPVVSVFGPTVPAQGYSPWQKQATVVEIELGCRPCGAHGHQKCPLKHHQCMKNISPQVVLGALKPYLRTLS